MNHKFWRKVEKMPIIIPEFWNFSRINDEILEEIVEKVVELMILNIWK